MVQLVTIIANALDDRERIMKLLTDPSSTTASNIPSATVSTAPSIPTTPTRRSALTSTSINSSSQSSSTANLNPNTIVSSMPSQGLLATAPPLASNTIQATRPRLPPPIIPIESSSISTSQRSTNVISNSNLIQSIQLSPPRSGSAISTSTNSTIHSQHIVPLPPPSSTSSSLSSSSPVSVTTSTLLPSNPPPPPSPQPNVSALPSQVNAPVSYSAPPIPAPHQRKARNSTSTQSSTDRKSNPVLSSTSSSPTPTPSHLQSIQPVNVWETLLSYAEMSESPLPASTIAKNNNRSSSSSLYSDSTLDASVIRYGSKVMIRSENGSGFLSIVSNSKTRHIYTENKNSSTSSSSSSSSPPKISLDGNGIGAKNELFVIVHASHSSGCVSSIKGEKGEEGYVWAGLAEGLPVRTGDVICLRSAATGRFLGAANQIPDSSTSYQFPAYATTEAKQITLSIQGANGNTGGASIEQRWTIVSPDSVLAAQAAFSRGFTGRLPRPYITGGQRFILISHSPPLSSLPSTSSSSSSSLSLSSVSVIASAKAAATRLVCAACGIINSNNLNTSKNQNQKSRIAYIDSASSTVGASIISTDDLLETSQSISSSIQRSPLSQVGLAGAILSSPPIDLLWSFHPVLLGETPPEGVSVAIPLHWPSDDVTCAPFLTGTYGLPRELLPRTIALQSSSIKAQYDREMASLTNLPRSSPTEKEVIVSILDALQGMPSLWFILNTEGLKIKRFSKEDSESLEINLNNSTTSEGECVDWDAVCTGPLVGSLLEHAQFELSPLSLKMMDQAHQALSRRLLPLATYMLRCSWYAERRSRCGENLTAHALAAAVSSLLSEFSHLLVQIENQLLFPQQNIPPLLLTQLWYYMQPSLRTFQALDEILYTSPYAKGGALLNSITTFTLFNGDEVLVDLATYLLERSFAPLLTWLERWLYNGTLDDPHQEFFIQENTAMLSRATFKAEDWSMRFSLIKENIPTLLLSQSDAILRAGKSLFALKLCRSSAGPVKITILPSPQVSSIYKNDFNDSKKDFKDTKDTDIIVSTDDNHTTSSTTRTGIASSSSSTHPAGIGIGGQQTTTTRSISSRRSSTSSSVDLTSGKTLSQFGNSNSNSSSSITATTHPSSPRPSGLNLFSINSSSSSLTTNAINSPTKKSTVIGADIQGVIPRELAPEESQSVLDRVFSSRRQSQASLVESIPAAGLPSVSMASVSSVPFDARFLGGGSNAFPTLEFIPSIGARKGNTIKGNKENRHEGGDIKEEEEEQDKDLWRSDDLVIKEAEVATEISIWLSAVKEAVRNTTESTIPPFSSKIPFSLDPQSYSQHVQRANTFASSKLLEFLYSRPSDHAPTLRASPSKGVLVERNLGSDLLGQLQTLKVFFLMSQGDWVVGFLDLAENELGSTVLNTSASLTLKQKLGAFLETAIKASVSNNDPHSASISCCISPLSLLATMDTEHLNKTGIILSSSSPTQSIRGCDVFCLEMDIKGPAALVLSPLAISKYKLLFRHLFLVRHVERAVSVAWLAHQSCKELDGNLRALLSHSHSLRHRMLHFLQNLSYFVSVEVIEPRWHEMAQKLRSATSLDDVIFAHTLFLETCMSESLLKSLDLLKLLTKLVTLCLIFSDQISKAIHDHRLPEDELDKRAGVNRAGLRTRTLRERGEYYIDGGLVSSTSAESDDKSSQRLALGSRRSSKQQVLLNVGTSIHGTASIQDRARRASRLEVQAVAMQSHMAQAGWQAMIDKSARIFDGLLRDFILALATRARDEHDGPISRLLTRIDFNHHFSNLWGFEA
jgi:hypothetical protein